MESMAIGISIEFKSLQKTTLLASTLLYEEIAAFVLVLILAKVNTGTSTKVYIEYFTPYAKPMEQIY